MVGGRRPTHRRSPCGAAYLQGWVAPTRATPLVGITLQGRCLLWPVVIAPSGRRARRGGMHPLWRPCLQG
ncbi:unnamed protein product [Musa textilis]